MYMITTKEVLIAGSNRVQSTNDIDRMDGVILEHGSTMMRRLTCPSIRSLTDNYYL